jgi:hypothetical protein
MPDLHLNETTTGQQQPKARVNLGAIGPRPHRADTMGPSSYGNTLLRVAVIFLSSINAVMWEVYTESTFMALVWVAIVVGFIGWMIYDKGHR